MNFSMRIESEYIESQTNHMQTKCFEQCVPGPITTGDLNEEQVCSCISATIKQNNKTNPNTQNR